MLNLIRLHFRTLFTHKFFYVCAILSFILGPFITFLADILLKSKPSMAFPRIMGFLTGELGIITSVFIVIFVCLEISEDNLKNIISRGYKRSQVLISKYIVSVIAVFMIHFLVALLTFVISIKNGIGYTSDINYVLIAYFFSILAQVAFITFLAFVLGKISYAIIISVILPIVLPMVFTLIETKYNLPLSNYWVTSSIDLVVDKNTISSLLQSGAISIAYIIVFLVLAIILTKNREVK